MFKYLVDYLIKFILLVVPATVGCWLGETAGLPGIGIGLAIATVLAILGRISLMTLQVGQMDARNVVAGLLLPWGYKASRFEPNNIALFNWITWFGLFLIGWSTTFASKNTGENGLIFGMISDEWILVVTWLVLGAGIIKVLDQLGHAGEWSQRPARTILKFAGFLALMLASSIASHLVRLDLLAMLVATLPVAICGGLYGLWILFILTLGRNARWN